MMGWYGGWGSNWLAMALMTVSWIALIVAVTWVAIRVVGGGSRSTEGTATPTPRAILDRRLASGEIDAEEYAQLRRLLDGHPSSTGRSPTLPRRVPDRG